MSDGWIPWDGSRDFKGDALLMVKFRNGRIASTHSGPTILPASKWRGRYGRQYPGSGFKGTFPQDCPSDIIAVKKV